MSFFKLSKEIHISLLLEWLPFYKEYAALDVAFCLWSIREHWLGILRDPVLRVDPPLGKAMPQLSYYSWLVDRQLNAVTLCLNMGCLAEIAAIQGLRLPSVRKIILTGHCSHAPYDMVPRLALVIGRCTNAVSLALQGKVFPADADGAVLRILSALPTTFQLRSFGCDAAAALSQQTLYAVVRRFSGSLEELDCTFPTEPSRSRHTSSPTTQRCHPLLWEALVNGCPNLTRLCFGDLVVTLEMLKKLCSQHGSALRVLDVELLAERYQDDAQSDGICESIMKLLPQLEALVLKCSSDICAPQCYAHCPKLRMLQVGDLLLDLSPAVASFTMKGQGVVPATVVKQLKALPICLKRISAVSSVSYGSRRSDIFINNVRLASSSLLAIAAKHGPALEWTDLLLNPLLQNEQKFVTFLQSCPKLSTLRLIALDRDDMDCLDEEDEEEDTLDEESADQQLPFDGTLQLIATHCSHLQALIVDGTHLSDEGLIAVLTNCAMLKELSVGRASAAITSALLDFVGNLTVLGFQDNHDEPQLAITEDDLVAALLANKFRNLRRLLWKDGKSAVSFIAAAAHLDTAAKHRTALLTVEAAGGW